QNFDSTMCTAKNCHIFTCRTAGPGAIREYEMTSFPPLPAPCRQTYCPLSNRQLYLVPDCENSQASGCTGNGPAKRRATSLNSPDAHTAVHDRRPPPHVHQD